LRIYSQYKFVIAFENSNSQGYITEKIFNVFLANSIPIYDGDTNVTEFINPNSFLQYDNMIVKKVQMLMNNEQLYNSIIEKEKTKKLDYSFINDNFDKMFKKD
jgi:alpha(1,3/1,4) fucosyltransferase